MKINCKTNRCGGDVVNRTQALIKIQDKRWPSNKQPKWNISEEELLEECLDPYAGYV